MIKSTSPEQCCGCTACESICAHDAITMAPDEMGFLYPDVDESKCVDCGLCEKVCHFNENYSKPFDFEQPSAFAARHINTSEIETSRSGATFVAISDWIINQDGVVYGAGYSGHFVVTHKRIENKEDRKELKGSKYVQSDIRGIFLQVREDLSHGKKVLFTGTPCQINGLKAFINKKFHENLYLMDIVCQGVPGPFVWRDYIAELEKKVGKKIAKVDFRDKHMFPWDYHRESFVFDGEEKKRVFPYSFYSSAIFRPSCSSCPFCNTNRPSDITIADFWGWEKVDPSLNADGKGINLVLVNTPKGEYIFNGIKPNLQFKEVPLSDCLQPNLKAASAKNPNSKLFRQDYVSKGMRYCMKKYLAIQRPSLLRKISRRLKRLLCI